MNAFWEMLTTTLGTAGVIASVSTLFFSSKKRSELHKNNKNLHRILVGIVMGLLSMYASASAIKVDGALCNCRNLGPLYAGFVAGPVAGVIAALIGGLFRYFVYGGDSALPCMLACFLAGIIGSFAHIAVIKKYRYDVLTAVLASLVAEICHMGLLFAFGQGELAKVIALPIIIANVLGISFCMIMYKRCNPHKSEN